MSICITFWFILDLFWVAVVSGPIYFVDSMFSHERLVLR